MLSVKRSMLVNKKFPPSAPPGARLAIPVKSTTQQQLADLQQMGYNTLILMIYSPQQLRSILTLSATHIQSC